MVINITKHTDQLAKIEPRGFLGPEAFPRYLACCRSTGAIFEKSIKAHTVNLANIPHLIDQLRSNGFDPNVVGNLESESVKVRITQEIDSEKHVEKICEKIESRGYKIRPYQRLGSSRLISNRGFCLFDNVGLGKDQPVDTPVLTPNGWRQIGSLQVGDFVIGSNGKPVQVIGVFPQGIKDIYKITFSDLSSTETGADHLWHINLDNNPAQRVILSTHKIMKDLQYPLSHEYYIPLLSAPYAHINLNTAVDLILNVSSLDIENYAFLTSGHKDKKLVIEVVEILGGVMMSFNHGWYICLPEHIDTSKHPGLRFKKPYRKIVSVRYSREAESVCIAVDAPDQLYVTEHCILTHNTIQSCMAIPQNKNPLLIVCPSVIKLNWEREIKQWRPEYEVTQLSGRGSFRWPDNGEAVVINYDILPPAVRKGKAGWVLDDIWGKPKPETVVIYDEAHKAKNNSSSRNRSARGIAKAVRANDGYTWALTGTPLTNHPQELWNIFDLAGVANATFGNWNNYVRLFQGQIGKRGYVVWGNPLPEIIPIMQKYSLRRTLESVGSEIPPMTEMVIDVDIDDATKAQCDKAIELLDQLGISLEAAMAMSIATKDAGAAFAALSRARKMLAAAKVPFMLDIVEEYEENEEPLLVFCSKVAPIAILEKRPGWGIITGEVNQRDRQHVIDEFQSGRMKGVGLTIAAGGIGINLTKAAHALFIDKEWTPAANTQAWGRIRRIGQSRAQFVKYIVANHKLDRRIHEILTRKEEYNRGSVEASTVGGLER